MLLSPVSGGSSARGRGETLSASGIFVAKLWAGGEQQQLLTDMRSRYVSSFSPTLTIYVTLGISTDLLP